MAGKKSKEVQASRVNEAAEQIVHEQDEPRHATRDEAGATDPFQGGTTNQVGEDGTDRATDRAVTRSQGDAPNPPLGATNRNRGGAAVRGR